MICEDRGQGASHASAGTRVNSPRFASLHGVRDGQHLALNGDPKSCRRRVRSKAMCIAMSPVGSGIAGLSTAYELMKRGLHRKRYDGAHVGASCASLR